MNRLLGEVLFFFILIVFPGLAQSASTDPNNLLVWLAQQNQAARDKITSCSYSFEYQSKNNQSGGETIASGTVIAKGNNLQLFSNQKDISKKRNFNRTSEHRLVVNDSYMAEYTYTRGLQTYASRNDFDSFDTMDSRTKSLIKRTRKLDIFEHCFGTDGKTFLEAITTRPDRIRWDAVKIEGPKGQTLYQIRRFPMGRLVETLNPAPDKIWVLDPEKDFLVVETRSYQSNGQLWGQRIIESRQIDNIWCPVSYKEESYDDSLSNYAMLSTRTTTMDMEDVKVNETLTNSLFQIDALRLEEDFPDIIVLRHKTDGSKTTAYVYYEGRLTPQQVADKLRAQQKP